LALGERTESFVEGCIHNPETAAIEPNATVNSKVNQMMWREMCIQDVPSVCSIAMDIWSGYGETPEIYENKFLVSPRGCYVYVVNDVIKGYVISHPWNIRSPPPLNTPLSEVDVNCWFIHDIVVLPECRGRGVGDEIIQRILADNPIVSLVACDNDLLREGRDKSPSGSLENMSISMESDALHKSSIQYRHQSIRPDIKTKDFWVRYGFEVAEALDCDYGIYMIRNRGGAIINNSQSL